MSSTVTLSSKNQVVIPQEARKKLGVGPGTRLLVLVKDDRIVFMPEPKDFVKRFSDRHTGVWGKGELKHEGVRSCFLQGLGLSFSHGPPASH